MILITRISQNPNYPTRTNRVTRTPTPRFRESGVLGGNPSILLDSTNFGGPNCSYGMPMRYSYYPHSPVQIRGANREIEIWIWRS
jgi:hypothetical protein